LNKQVTVAPLVKKYRNVCVNTLPIDAEQELEDTDVIAIDTRLFRINIDRTRKEEEGEVTTTTTTTTTGDDLLLYVYAFVVHSTQ
jgi:hypothetical protein